MSGIFVSLSVLRTIRYSGKGGCRPQNHPKQVHLAKVFWLGGGHVPSDECLKTQLASLQHAALGITHVQRAAGAEQSFTDYLVSVLRESCPEFSWRLDVLNAKDCVKRFRDHKFGGCL